MKIFDTYTLGNTGLTLKNRILRSATWEGISTPEGHMTEAQYDVYRKLAEGQVGLICTGYARITKDGEPNQGMMGIYDDCFVEDYQKLTEMVHSYGSKIMMQIAYGSTKTTYRVDERTILAPGDVTDKATGVTGQPMTAEDIREMIEYYRKAAVRVKKSGFDAVELHAGHSYLLNQFLSPYYNNRQDDYGQTLAGRERFLDEVYAAVREAVGKDFPILIKITCSEFCEGGLTFADVLQVCQHLEKIGIDAIEVSGNVHGKAEKMTGQEFDGCKIEKNGYFLEYAQKIAEKVQIPVILTGGNRAPEAMENQLEECGIAMFGFSRPLLSEPGLVKRWIDGDHKTARCVHCSKCRTPEGNYCTVFKNR